MQLTSCSLISFRKSYFNFLTRQNEDLHHFTIYLSFSLPFSPLFFYSLSFSLSFYSLSFYSLSFNSLSFSLSFSSFHCIALHCTAPHCISPLSNLRLVSTQDNFPQDGNGQESFLCLMSSRSELMALTQRKLSCPFLSWGTFSWVETSL